MAKKRISTDELIERIKSVRKRGRDPKLAEEFNRFVEEQEREQERKRIRRIARPRSQSF